MNDVGVRTAGRQLAIFAIDQEGFRLLADAPRHAHLGALLADASLQAGLNYTTVVFPRVQSIMREYAAASTMSGLCSVLCRVSPSTFLRWSHPEKVRRFEQMLDAIRMDVETVADLSDWMVVDQHRKLLLSIVGVGNKTVDYLARLAGAAEIAVDRHVRRFLEAAGIFVADYFDAKVVVGEAADLLGVRRDCFDASIWRYMAAREHVSRRAG